MSGTVTGIGLTMIRYSIVTHTDTHTHQLLLAYYIGQGEVANSLL